MVELLNIDCLEYMAGLPDKAFQLAVVDPPYGIDAGKMTMGSGNHKFKKGKEWDAGIPNQEYFDQLFRVSVNQIIWGANYFTGFLDSNNNWIIWDKLNPNLSFSEGELAWCSIKRNVRIFKHYSAMPEEFGGKIHPTQKPKDLYKYLFHHYAKKGDKILDTHLGSGSSAIAAHQMGFDFVGCELDKDYYDAACKRFREQTMQQQLFT